MNVQRRNLAILYAYERGAEVIITIDDDNFFVDGQDFLGEHAAPLIGEPPELEALSSSSSWLNICDFLEDHRGFSFYPRGYPMNQRWPAVPPLVRARRERRRVVANGGLWLGDPDVDAVTRLCNDISAVRYTREGNFTLARRTW